MKALIRQGPQGPQAKARDKEYSKFVKALIWVLLAEAEFILSRNRPIKSV